MSTAKVKRRIAPSAPPAATSSAACHGSRDGWAGPESRVSESVTSSKRRAAISTVCIRGSSRRGWCGAGVGLEVTATAYRRPLRHGCSAACSRTTPHPPAAPCPRSPPDEAQGGLLEHRGDVAQQLRAQCAVDQAVVEAQRERGDLARHDLPVHHPRLLLDRADAEDRGIAGVAAG